MSFLTELKRRNVFKVGVAYAIVAWLLVQAASIVLPAYGAPDWTIPVFITLVSLGFPIALVLAWAYELTPEGIKPTTPIDSGAPASSTPGLPLNLIIIALLSLTLVFVVVDNYVLDTDQEQVADAAAGSISTDSDTTSRVADTPAPLPEPEQDVLPNSVAVLPFENISPNANDAYFATGLHEEVLNQLAKLKNLNVIARTTMRQYENTSKPLAQIAQELKVKSIMEGSVRYADGRIRVTTQLIDPVTGGHLWSETYDHDFKDIFEIQTNIAMNVANALQVQFSMSDQAAIAGRPTQSPEAYALYLEARPLIDSLIRENILAGLDRINLALELDPGFAQAWVVKARAFEVMAIFLPDRLQGNHIEAETALQQALAIDPDLPEGHFLLSNLEITRFQWKQAQSEINQVIALGGYDNPTFHATVGHINKALQAALTILKRDPLRIEVSNFVMMSYAVLDDIDGVLREYGRGKSLFPEVSGYHSVAVLSLLGYNDGEYSRQIARAMSVPTTPLFHAALLDAPTPEQALKELHRIYDLEVNATPIRRMVVATLAAFLGDQQFVISIIKRIGFGSDFPVYYVWLPVFHDVRQMPEFKDYVREIGLVDYWQEYGWPDLCRPLGTDDFVCD